jgi:hypothetical protein
MILSVEVLTMPLHASVQGVLVCIAYDSIQHKAPRGVAIALSPADRRRKLELWYAHHHEW